MQTRAIALSALLATSALTGAALAQDNPMVGGASM